MPMPIRPVNQTDSIFPSVMNDDRGVGLFGLQDSPMQQMLKRELERRDNREVVAERKQGVDPRDVELIHRIWMDQPDEGNVATAASEARGMVSLQVPKDANSYDLMRLKTNGLAIGSGDVITLTKKGQKVLKDKILSTPSSFWLNRTKDGFDMKAAQPRSPKLVRLAGGNPPVQSELADETENGHDIAERESSLRKAARNVRIAEDLTTPPGYGNVFDPDPARRPQVQSEPMRLKNIPGFLEWYNKELQPGRDKDVDARSRYVKQHAGGWLSPLFRPWAAKEYYDKALQYAPNEYPYLPSEKELELDERLEQERKDYERWLKSPDSKRFPVAPSPQASTGWGQTVMAANAAARRAVAEENEPGDCTHCKGTGLFPGGYRKRTQKCFYCGGTGKAAQD